MSKVQKHHKVKKNIYFSPNSQSRNRTVFINASPLIQNSTNPTLYFASGLVLHHHLALALIIVLVVRDLLRIISIAKDIVLVEEDLLARPKLLREEYFGAVAITE